MADRYWVGGTASWDGTAGTKWALTSGGAGGEAVPTTADDVFFDAASGAVTVTVGASSACLDIDFTGFTGTFAGSSSLEVRGSWVGDAGVTRTYTGTITLSATDSRTITSNGMALDGALTFNGSGGTWALQDNLTTGATRVVTLTTGTLNLGSHDIAGRSLSSSNSNARSIIGSGDFRVINASGASVVVWLTTTSTNLDLSGWTGAIRLVGAGAGTSQSINGGSAELPHISVEAGSFAVDPSVGLSCASYTQTSGYTGILESAAMTVRGSFTLDPANGTPEAGTSALTLTGTGAVDMAGKTFDRPVTINAPAATVTLADPLDIQARALTLANGTFDQAAQAITCGSCVVNGTTIALASDLDIGTAPLTFTAGTFDADANDIDAGSVVATGSGTRVIDLTGSTVTLASTGTAWDATGSNITLTTTGSTIACVDPDVTFAGGGKTYNAVRFARGGTVAITGSNTIATLALA